MIRIPEQPMRTVKVNSALSPFYARTASVGRVLLFKNEKCDIIHT